MGTLKNLVNIGIGIGKRKAHRKCTAIIAAGGSSSRMGGENKQFIDLCGIPVLARTLLMYESNSNIDDIVVVARKEDVGRVSSLCADFSITKVIKIVPGGDTRTQSVLNGLAVVPPKTEFIAIADGARPLVTKEIIDETVKAAIAFAAAAPGIPVVSTVKKIKNGNIVSTVPREELVQIQTPQVFEASLIKAALKDAQDKKAELTDDCMAVEQMHIPIRLTTGSEENLKITTPTDLLLAEQILKGREKP
ncbi:MAG: 2-C-methyl-D-erythritol 4-phosphate cytidylyltransferase [Oscillospiraceae bacterium]|nr:2-C-methyl-D-erythritol 4-phosphate cytidylyltransferase [Oscillospiraceae bacterium]